MNSIVHNHSHGGLRDTLDDNRRDILKKKIRSFLTRIGCAVPISIFIQSSLIFQLHVTEISATLSLNFCFGPFTEM
jgi:hypothetical protein